jgi:uncharacterized membrane protein YphA (DoxX/SURF4 family)
MMILTYLLSFCRLVIGLAFILSFVGKVRDIDRFAETIGRFELLPRRWTKTAALLFLGGEAAVVVLIIAGGPLLFLAFGLAILLLFVFTLALLSALRRGIETSCNCFGASEKPLTYYDIWRNVGFISCSVLGWWLAAQVPVTTQPSNWAELALLSFGAALFVIVWTQLGELATLLANPK